MIFCDWIYILKVLNLSLDLLGHPVMAHLDKLRSMCNRYCKFLEFGYLGLEMLYVIGDYR